MNDHRFSLEAYRAGGGNRYTCPQCGRKKCFTRYVDNATGQYVDAQCGRCEHVHRCGYHYPPRAYFHDNAWRTPAHLGIPREPYESLGTPRKAAAPAHLGIPREPYEPLGNPRKAAAPAAAPLGTPRKAPAPLPTPEDDLVSACHSPNSQFVCWLMATLGDERPVRRVYDDYRLGATRDGGVIFWQIGIDGHVRAGKIMHYGADGHRRGHPGWVHAELKRRGVYAPDYQPPKCLFGEHLLAARPTDVVCLVESEKTAVVCAARYPQCLWLATGGCAMLSADRLGCLAERRVLVWPDSGMLATWREHLQPVQGLRYTLVDSLERYPPNTDLADLLARPPGLGS